jgi:hypothetical protein
MFLILADFLSTLGGGRKDIYTGPATQGVACRYGIAVGLLTVRPGRYGKDRRAGRQGKQDVAHRYGIAVGLLTVRPCRYGKETRAGRPRHIGRGVPVRDSCKAPHRAPRPVRQGNKSGQAEGLQGGPVRGRQLHHAHNHNQLIT